MCKGSVFSVSPDSPSRKKTLLFVLQLPFVQPCQLPWRPQHILLPISFADTCLSAKHWASPPRMPVSWKPLTLASGERQSLHSTHPLWVRVETTAHHYPSPKPSTLIFTNALETVDSGTHFIHIFSNSYLMPHWKIEALAISDHSLAFSDLGHSPETMIHFPYWSI